MIFTLINYSLFKIFCCNTWTPRILQTTRNVCGVQSHWTVGLPMPCTHKTKRALRKSSMPATSSKILMKKTQIILLWPWMKYSRIFRIKTLNGASFLKPMNIPPAKGWGASATLSPRRSYRLETKQTMTHLSIKTQLLHRWRKEPKTMRHWSRTSFTKLLRLQIRFWKLAGLNMTQSPLGQTLQTLWSNLPNVHTKPGMS